MSSTPTDALLDVNVVIAAIFADHVMTVRRGGLSRDRFTGVGMRSMQGHRQWTDAYLLFLARSHGLALASLESRMANLDDPDNPVLFVVN